MSDEKAAALVDPLDAFVMSDDHTDIDTKEETTTTESAPVEEVVEPEKNTVQERINKITAEKHKERREREAEAKRADELQAKLDAIESKKPVLSKPELENFDYDEEAFNKANLDYEVQEKVKAELANQRLQQANLDQQAKAEEAAKAFNEKANALGKEDFVEKANAIPQLPQGVADAIMNLDNGAELVYHLGTHLDLADSLANMTPLTAMMEVGKLSLSMTAKPEIKTSAAPDPIEPLGSGGALGSKDIEDMTIEEFMAAHG